MAQKILNQEEKIPFGQSFSAAENPFYYDGSMEEPEENPYIQKEEEKGGANGAGLIGTIGKIVASII